MSHCGDADGICVGLVGRLLGFFVGDTDGTVVGMVLGANDGALVGRTV